MDGEAAVGVVITPRRVGGMVDEVSAEKTGVWDLLLLEHLNGGGGEVYGHHLQPQAGEVDGVPAVAAAQVYQGLAGFHQGGDVLGKGGGLGGTDLVLIILVPVVGVVDGIFDDVGVKDPLNLLHLFQRCVVAVVLDDEVGGLRFVEGQVHPYHVAAGGVEALLVALEEGVLGDPDVNLFIVGDVLPVPLPDGVEHSNRAANHIDALVGQKLAHPEDAPGPAQPLLLSIPHILAKGKADLISVQVDGVGLGVF